MNDPNFQKINKAIYHLQLAAYNNYADAQLVMGDYYLCGDFFPKNINKAIEYYKKAADQDCTKFFI